MSSASEISKQPKAKLKSGVMKPLEWLDCSRRQYQCPFTVYCTVSFLYRTDRKVVDCNSWESSGVHR